MLSIGGGENHKRRLGAMFDSEVFASFLFCRR